MSSAPANDFVSWLWTLSVIFDCSDEGAAAIDAVIAAA